MLSKVPAVTVWFWIIKILCTTVGESFADWISTTVGLGLSVTALIFTVALGVVLSFQLLLDRYLPMVYWLAVVALSICASVAAIAGVFCPITLVANSLASCVRLVTICGGGTVAANAVS